MSELTTVSDWSLQTFRKGRFQDRGDEDLLTARMNTGDVKGRACLHLTSELAMKSKILPRFSRHPPLHSPTWLGLEATMEWKLSHFLKSELEESSFQAKGKNSVSKVGWLLKRDRSNWKAQQGKRMGGKEEGRD